MPPALAAAAPRGAARLLAPFLLYVAAAAAGPAPQLFWWRYPQTDCGYDDVPGSCAGQSIEGCKAICTATVGCGGFNYPHGILKQTSCVSKMAPEGSVTLYVLRDIPQPPPPTPAWGNVWPIPANYSLPGGLPAGTAETSFPLRVSPQLAITADSASPRLSRAIARYTTIIANASASAPHPAAAAATAAAATAAATTDITKLSLHVLTPDEALTADTDYSYTLEVAADGTASATAATIYGAMYAMETFSQLGSRAAADGALHINATSVTISDAPHYAHRGFMADTGRRFWPVYTVEAVLDAMSWSKLNVLHLHLSDNCRYGVESDSFPLLTARLKGVLGGFYSKGDIAHLSAYAADRGIRLIPEVDVPGHAEGLQGLGGGNGLVFCGEGQEDDGSDGVGGGGAAAAAGVPDMFGDLRNDAEGTTLTTVRAIYSELAALFPDTGELFIGADETAPNGPCTVAGDYAPIEMALTAHVTGALNRTVGGWEEYAFETGVARAGDPRYLVNTWHYHTQFEATARGFHTVAANDSHFYLVYGQGWESYWTDIASGMNASQQALLHGGIVSAWGDEYCYVAYCIHLDQFPAAHALFPPSADALFHESIIGVAFPRTAVAAGSFWNYEGEASAPPAQVASAVDVLNARLAARGLPTCPQDCGCNAASRCGHQYANETMMAVPANETLPLDELLALRHPGMAARARALARQGGQGRHL